MKNKGLCQKIIGIAFLVLAVIILVAAIKAKSIGSLVSSFLLIILGTAMIEMKAKDFNNPYTFLLVILLTFPFYLLLMITTFKGTTKIWFDSLKLDQWIDLYGSLLAYAGTICLGLVTILQNKRITDITEKSVNGDIKDKKGFLLPKVYDIRDNKEYEKYYDIAGSGVCFYNAGNDYINNFKILSCQIKGFKDYLDSAKNCKMNFIGLSGDSQRVYIPLICADSKAFESADRTVLFTFAMTNSKGYKYQQNLEVMLEHYSANRHKIKGYDTSFSEIKALKEPLDK